LASQTIKQSELEAGLGEPAQHEAHTGRK
jgi:hypothetical protein